MKKPSLSDRLTAYIRRDTGWISGGELQRLAMNAGRRLRELVEDGTLEVEYRNPHHHAWYRYKTQRKTVTEYVVKDGVAVAIHRQVTA